MQFLLPSLDGARVDRLAIWICFFVALGISLLWSWYFLPFVWDDALISYRYSERLLHGKGLTWNDGEYVEGYSNLLWVLLVAAGGLIQPNLIRTGWILGLLANAAVLAAIVWAFGRSGRSAVFAVAGGLLVLALSSSFGLWAIGGLETPLVEALLAWTLATTYRMPCSGWSLMCPGLLLGFLSVTRPDGIVLAAGIAVVLVFRDAFSRIAFQGALRLLLLPVVFTTAQVVFRLAYYGSPVPNTAYVKVAFTPERLWVGSLYVAQGLVANSIPLVIILLTALFLWRLRQQRAVREAGLFLIPAALWLGYVNIVGGDTFYYYRQWMPALVCLAFALSSLLAALPCIQPLRMTAFFAVSVILHLTVQQVVNPWSVPYVQSPDSARLVARSEAAYPDLYTHPLLVGRRIVANCIVLGRFVHDAFAAQRPLIAVNFAGCMPYASQLPALDMLGLTDSHIAHHRPVDMGRGVTGHELGDGAYVLSRKPDLVTFCVPATGAAEPCFRGEVEMAGMRDFRRDYRLVFFRAGSVDGVVWTRVEDGRLGIVRTADTIRIPGFLLATRPGVRAVLDSDGRPVAALESGEAAIENIDLPSGTWQISLETDASSHLRLEIPPAIKSTALRQDTLRIESDGTPLSFQVVGERGLIYGITARRVVEQGGH